MSRTYKASHRSYRPSHGGGRIRRELLNEDGPPFRPEGFAFSKWNYHRVSTDFPRKLIRNMIAEGYLLCDIRKSLRRRHIPSWMISYLFHEFKEHACARWWRNPCKLEEEIIYVKREKELREKVVYRAEEQPVDSEAEQEQPPHPEQVL